MKASIIIVNWNGKHHLDRCISSIINQTYKNLEILFVDNNSKDGSSEFLKEKFGKYEGLKIIELNDNYGFAKANNIGVKQATGEYIIFLNNDTEVDKYWLEELIKTAEKSSEIGFVASKMILFDNREILDNAGVAYSIGGSVREYGRYENHNKYNEEKEITIACAGSALYKKEVLDKVGVFDEKFFISYEDIDLSLKAIWAGYKGIYQPKAITYHKLKASRKNDIGMYTYYNQRNNSYVWYKNIPNNLKRKYFFHRSIYNIGCLFNSIKIGNMKYYIRAKVDFIKSKDSIEKNNFRVITEKEFEKNLEKEFVTNKIKKFIGAKNA